MLYVCTAYFTRTLSSRPSCQLVFWLVKTVVSSGWYNWRRDAVEVLHFLLVATYRSVCNYKAGVSKCSYISWRRWYVTCSGPSIFNFCCADFIFIFSDYIFNSAVYHDVTEVCLAVTGSAEICNLSGIILHRITFWMVILLWYECACCLFYVSICSIDRRSKQVTCW